MKLALTGLTSGIGARLAEIALERGDQVTGLVRNPDGDVPRKLEARGAKLVRGDLDDLDALRELARCADAFCHLAAHVGDRGPVEQFVRVNVTGTKHAVEAAADVGVRRFVQMSSSSVYGRPDRGRVTEGWPTIHTGLPYEDTKTDAERLAFELGAERGLSVTAVRPPIVYGEYDRNFMPRMVDALRGKRFVLIDGGRAPLNVVWVDHVVDVTLLCAERDDLAGEAFNVMDEGAGKPPTVREVAETVARETGLALPRLSLPYPVAMGLGHVVHRAFQAFGGDKSPPLSPFVVKILTREVIYDASKAIEVLGWRPKLGALEGVARFARTYARA